VTFERAHDACASRDNATSCAARLSESARCGLADFVALRQRQTRIELLAGTREYLTCESGELELIASGESFAMEEGDVVVFRGDQRHSYANRGKKAAVGYSVVMLRPIE
jgi:mannose-6-phosphate isomerase-like protein (cupin superfamily)